MTFPSTAINKIVLKMEEIKNLYDFVKYCESVGEENNDMFLISIFAANLTKEELLQDIRKCLTIYYKWLKVAVDSEYYLMADKIWTAKDYEIKHYCTLGKMINKKSINQKIIIEIDEELKQEYLLNGENNK